jgi:hypothetical protein
MRRQKGNKPPGFMHACSGRSTPPPRSAAPRRASPIVRRACRAGAAFPARPSSASWAMPQAPARNLRRAPPGARKPRDSPRRRLPGGSGSPLESRRLRNSFGQEVQPRPRPAGTAGRGAPSRSSQRRITTTRSARAATAANASSSAPGSASAATGRAKPARAAAKNRQFYRSSHTDEASSGVARSQGAAAPAARSASRLVSWRSISYS